jgi:hypothetical protein
MQLQEEQDVVESDSVFLCYLLLFSIEVQEMNPDSVLHRSTLYLLVFVILLWVKWATVVGEGSFNKIVADGLIWL